MTIRISNESASLLAAGYAIREDGLIVWLDIAPQHKKLVGAIRAEMTSNSQKYMRLVDNEAGLSRTVYGLGRGYLVFTADDPHLAAGPQARPLFLRMVAPEAVQPEDPSLDFYVFDFPKHGITPADALAAALERYSSVPVLPEWGDYLFRHVTGRNSKKAEPLLTAGTVPTGYHIPAGIPWGAVISNGIRDGHISIPQ